MNDLINSKVGMTPKELEILTNYSLEIRNTKISTKVGQETWNKLKANERIALESAFYNGEAIIGKEQKNLLSQYVSTSNSQYLENAVSDLRQSSAKKNPDLNKRKERESTLLNSTQAPIYSKPNDDPIPKDYKNKQFKWIYHSSSKNSNPLHQQLDGKIFDINSEQWQWLTSKRQKGCKCSYEVLD